MGMKPFPSGDYKMPWSKSQYSVRCNIAGGRRRTEVEGEEEKEEMIIIMINNKYK